MSTIDRTVYRAARREGFPPSSAAYVARPPVLELDWDDDAALFTYDGVPFRAVLAWDDDCFCSEDEGMTDDVREAADHQSVTVEMLDDAGDVIDGASLFGVCTLTRNPIETRSAVRYIAETVRELAEELLYAERSRLAAESSRLWAVAP